MTLSLQFAYLSDIHISKEGNENFMVSEEVVAHFPEIVTELNNNSTLDFVFMGGDCLNYAHTTELEQFKALVSTIQKPLFIIPGNHDGNKVNDPNVFTQRYFASIFNPQFAHRPPAGQAGYFSITFKDKIQFIGLDSNIPGKTGGTVDEIQLQWLQEELATHADKLIVVAIHHPLYPLCEADKAGLWYDIFMCTNAEEVQELLNASKAVKLVLCGHHHVSKAFRAGNQLHIAAPPLASYPCAYRLITLYEQENEWYIKWQTVCLPATVQHKAAHLLKNSEFVRSFNPNDGQAFVDFAEGTAFDQKTEGVKLF